MEEANKKSNSANEAHLFVFTADKAGMGSADKAHVNRVVYEMSKDSAFFAHAKKNDAKTDAKIAEYKAKLATLSVQPTLLQSSLSSKSNTRGSNPLLRRVMELDHHLERLRYCSRPCVVVDMDAFYAAVEMRDQPALATVPMAVGGTGMISTANYVARRKGVRSAMPGFIARQLCPELVFVKPDFRKYKAASAQVKKVLLEYDPNAKMMSLDEGKLDLTAFFQRRMHEKSSLVCNNSSNNSSTSGGGSRGSVLVSNEELAAVVAEIRSRIKAATGGLTCSAGIGPNFMVAKIASDMNKPDGQYAVPLHSREALLSFLRPVPVRKVGGVVSVLGHAANSPFWHIFACSCFLLPGALDGPLASNYLPLPLTEYRRCFISSSHSYTCTHVLG